STGLAQVSQQLPIVLDVNHELLEGVPVKHSRYLSPEPVLKMTTVSSDRIQPDLASFPAAAQQAALSGATNKPSAAPTLLTASSISASVIAREVPPDWLTASRIRKSPIAFGTRKPEAMVEAFRCSVAKRSPA